MNAASNENPPWYSNAYVYTVCDLEHDNDVSCWSFEESFCDKCHTECTKEAVLTLLDTTAVVRVELIAASHHLKRQLMACRHWPVCNHGKRRSTRTAITVRHATGFQYSQNCYWWDFVRPDGWNTRSYQDILCRVLRREDSRWCDLRAKRVEGALDRHHGMLRQMIQPIVILLNIPLQRIWRHVGDTKN